MSCNFEPRQNILLLEQNVSPGVFGCWRVPHVDNQAYGHLWCGVALLNSSNSIDPSWPPFQIIFRFFSYKSFLKELYIQLRVGRRYYGIAVEAKRDHPYLSMEPPGDRRNTFESLWSFWIFQYIWPRAIRAGWLLPWNVPLGNCLTGEIISVCCEGLVGTWLLSCFHFLVIINLCAGFCVNIKFSFL